MKIQTRIYSRKLPESIQNAISFDAIQFKHFKLFMEKPSLVMILCFRQGHVFQKWGVFQRSKGRGHEKFSRGQAPGPPFFCFARTSLQPPCMTLTAMISCTAHTAAHRLVGPVDLASFSEQITQRGKTAMFCVSLFALHQREGKKQF